MNSRIDSQGGEDVSLVENGVRTKVYGFSRQREGVDMFRVEIHVFDSEGQEILDKRKTIDLSGTLRAELNVTDQQLCEFFAHHRNYDWPDMLTTDDKEWLEVKIYNFRKRLGDVTQ